MNRLALILTICAAGAATHAAEMTDSVDCYARPDSVVIRHNDSRMKVEIFGTPGNPDFYYAYSRTSGENDFELTQESASGWNFTLPFVESKKEKGKKRSVFDFEMGGVAFGFVNALNAPSGMDVNMGNSFEILADHLLNLRCRPWRNGSSFSLGFGIAWRNYRMTGNTRLIKEGNSLVLGAYPENAEPGFSRIKMFSLTLPLMFQQELGKGFSFRCGPVLNFNVHASMKTKYKLDGTECKESDDHIHQQKVTVDLMAHLQYRAVGIYAKYSPCDMLVSDFGPKFSHFSAGLTLFY